MMLCCSVDEVSIPSPSRYASELYADSLIGGPGFSHTLGRQASSASALAAKEPAQSSSCDTARPALTVGHNTWYESWATGNGAQAP